MGSLYTFPMRLFWRRWQPKLSTLSQYFFFDLVRELSECIAVGSHARLMLSDI
jgi:hypothetical protein